jgi:hypothetical protein
MKRLLLVVLFLFTTACARVEPKVPTELVGIWASEDAVLADDKWLMSGQALYLSSNGSGALIVGPPPIGVKISATFDSAKNVLSIDLIEREKVVNNLSALYDPNTKTINVGYSNPTLLSRRSEVMDSSIKKGLGL